MIVKVAPDHVDCILVRTCTTISHHSILPMYIRPCLDVVRPRLLEFIIPSVGCCCPGGAERAGSSRVISSDNAHQAANDNDPYFSWSWTIQRYLISLSLFSQHPWNKVTESDSPFFLRNNRTRTEVYTHDWFNRAASFVTPYY